ncbi:MAG: phosphoadenosine phosphosulfate reductase family protein, partial [Oscillospiraceae bacterium]|nr:phosphoadenosine phosphosulfate reductase family protein [Oscillospiraceae bacterium]
MYQYKWDIETGGILLESESSKFSKEPRPVYYQELDLLGFDKYWKYKKDDTFPYMWAELNNYYYFGEQVAKLIGGALYSPPVIELTEAGQKLSESKKKLKFVNISEMVRKNETIMQSIINATLKTLYTTYLKYKKDVDSFHVAFSGGKDSIVLLDIVKRALPKGSFVVVFGDTGMEFPDTYDTVKKIKAQCEEEGIKFLTAKSHLKPEESWKLFGAPSQKLRWCCSVHKTTPQLLTLREDTKKPDYRGFSIIGARADESETRSKYAYVNQSKKQNAQYDCYPILSWNTAELYLYIYRNNLIFNQAYKKGNSRVGCIACPKTAGKSEWFCNACYPELSNHYIDIIRQTTQTDFSDKQFQEFMQNRGWHARGDGRHIKNNAIEYSEKNEDGNNILTIINPTTNWEEWAKTLDIEKTNDTTYRVSDYNFTVEYFENGYSITITEKISIYNPTLWKNFKNIFRKSAKCVYCEECVARCPFGYISMKNGQINIAKECKHCNLCNNIDNGCLRYNSLKLPKTEGSKMSDSLNQYTTHAPLYGWFEKCFNLKANFNTQHGLGANEYPTFVKFLVQSGIMDNTKEKNLTRLFQIIDTLGLLNSKSWGIMLVNLSYTPEIKWYVKNIPFDEIISRDELLSKLEKFNCHRTTSGRHIVSAFGRILDLPFGTSLELGTCEKKISGNKTSVLSITRGHWQNPEPLVILYGLYKFAKATENYQFTLSRIMDFDMDSEG